MSNLNARLDEIAKKACAEELPHGRLTQGNESMVTEYVEHRSIARPHITQAMQAFGAMTRLLMPGDAVDEYVESHCAHKEMPNVFRKASSVLLVPIWAENEPLNIRDQDGNLDRKKSMEKFTLSEVQACVNMAKKSPDMPLSFMYLQTLLEEYLLDLRSRIGQIDPPRTQSLEQFQQHWVAATNFMRFFMIAVSEQLPKDSDAAAIDVIDQHIVTKAFEMLEDIRAFEMSIPEMSMVGIEAMTFSCPAKPLLREMMVENGTYMRVVQKIREMRAGAYRSPHEREIHSTTMRAIGHFTEMTDVIVQSGNKSAFRTITNAFSGYIRSKKTSCPV